MIKKQDVIFRRAVLVAISIPVFTTQLEKSREATDLSNIRSMYAEAALVVLNGTGSNETSSVTGGTITATKDASKGYVKDVTVAGFKPIQQVSGWLIDVSNVGGVDISEYKPVKGTAAVSVKFSFDENGKFTGITAGA
ncbi:MAG: hypothetical protein Q4C09_01615 [Atopobiaceae bacterium]|nr:hypothetical protein [Atopobiaceae bacterium]